MHCPALMNNRTLQNLIRLICLAAIIAMILIACIIYRADLSGILVFTVFLIAYVQLPGLLILHWLKMRPSHYSTLLATSFFAGWAFLVLQYFLAELTGTDLLLLVPGPVCTILYLLLRIRNRVRPASAAGSLSAPRPMVPPFRFRDLSPAFCIFTVICLLYSMLMTQYLYLSPEVDKIITMNPDKGFHLGLINSLSLGWPLECPWFSGLYFNYHIFTELLYSVPVRLFGLTADLLLFCCGPYMTVYTFGISAYAFFREMSTKPQRAGLYCLVLLLSNIYIARGWSQSIAFLFIFRNENVAGYGVSCAFILVILIRYWYRSFAGSPAEAETSPAMTPEPLSAGIVTKLLGPPASRCLFLLLLMVLMLCTGIKGPFGAVIVASLWGTYILGLILRKVKPATVLPLLILSAGFYVVYAVILGSKGQSASAGESLIALGTLIDITFFKAPLIALMKSLGLPAILRYAVLLAVFTVSLLTVFFLPFVIGYIRELVLVLSRRKDFDFTRILVYAACLVGYVAMLLLNYHGHSQIYFGFVTVFFAPILAFWFFEDLEKNRDTLMTLLRGICLISLLVSTVLLGSFLVDQFSEAAEAANPDSTANKWESISHKEYEAMHWIDDNTPRDSLLATDRYYTVNPKKFDVTDRWDNRFFLYADYSNRICYLAGAGYNLPARDWKKRQERIKINDRLFDASDPGRGELARSLGIDYVVLSKRFTDAGNLENQDYQLVFSNKHINVYKITE